MSRSLSVICPLQTIGNSVPEYPEKGQFCYREDCAWWVERECAVKLIARNSGRKPILERIRSYFR
jgi:hypothetical protein